MIRIVLFSLLAFYLSCQSVQAETYTLAMPEKMKGLWAIPDCRHPDQFIYHSDRHVLYLTKEDVQLKSLSYYKTPHNYGMLNVEDDAYPVTIHEDGLLEIGILAEGKKLNPKHGWADLPIDQRREYTRCEDSIMPPHNIATGALEVLDVLEGHCGKTDSEQCKSAIFNQADINGDMRIQQDEIDLMNMRAIYLSPLISTERPLPHDRIRQNLARQSTASTQFARSLLQGTSGLSLAQINQYSWSTLPNIQTQGIQEAYKTILKTYPALKN